MCAVPFLFVDSKKWSKNVRGSVHDGMGGYAHTVAGDLSVGIALVPVELITSALFTYTSRYAY